MQEVMHACIDGSSVALSTAKIDHYPVTENSGEICAGGFTTSLLIWACEVSSPDSGAGTTGNVPGRPQARASKQSPCCPGRPRE